MSTVQYYKEHNNLENESVAVLMLLPEETAGTYSVG
jgi:hypothetical protein